MTRSTRFWGAEITLFIAVHVGQFRQFGKSAGQALGVAIAKNVDLSVADFVLESLDPSPVLGVDTLFGGLGEDLHCGIPHRVVIGGAGDAGVQLICQLADAFQVVPVIAFKKGGEQVGFARP